MKQNKWLYYGAALLIGIIIANYLVQKANRLAYLKKAQAKALALALKEKETNLRANIRTYWIDLETISDYWFVELDSLNRAIVDEAIKDLKELQKELKKVKDEQNNNLRFQHIGKQKKVDRSLKIAKKYIEAQLPEWSEKLDQIEDLETDVYSMIEDWPNWVESYNTLRLAYFSIIKGNLAQKWNMIDVEGGRLPANEYDSSSHEIESFYIGRFELTQKRWEVIIENNPSKYNIHDTYPVESINAYDAVMFCNKLSETYNLEPAYDIIIGNTGPPVVRRRPEANGFRLPTHQEWLYAAKGGKKSKGYRFAGSHDLGEVAHYASNANRPSRVGGKKYNELRLYDMSGNVYEWTTDSLASQFYNAGGSWYVGGYNCKLEEPQQYDIGKKLPYYGMRLLLPAKALNNE